MYWSSACPTPAIPFAWASPACRAPAKVPSSKCWACTSPASARRKSPYWRWTPPARYRAAASWATRRAWKRWPTTTAPSSGRRPPADRWAAWPAAPRPPPAGGWGGGGARRTRETMLLCEAAGYRNVLVETVGVGQSETAVRSMVDFFLLLMLAGAGDELQGMKRGIVEMTDLIAFNKADGNNRAKAEAARCEYESALHLFSVSGTGWTPRVITCSARAREGIAEIWDAVLEHNAWLSSTGQLAGYRQQQVKSWMYELIEQALRDEFLQHAGVREKLASYEQDVLAGRLSPFRAARRLIRIYTENPS